MLVNLDVYHALCSWVAGGRRANAFVGRTIRPREDPELIAHHERAQCERGAFVVERLPNLVAPGTWMCRAAVVGADPEAKDTDPQLQRVTAAEESGEPLAPVRGDASPADTAPPKPAEAAPSSRKDAAQPPAPPDASTPSPNPIAPAREPRLRRVRID